MRARSRRAYALIIVDGKALTVRNRAGRWGLPGGRAKDGETFQQALKREVREEIGVRIKVKERLPHSHVRNHRGPCEGCVVFAAKIKKGTPISAAEITRVRWVPLEDLPGTLTRFSTRRMTAVVEGAA